jgi:hypothetical protein
LTAYPVPPGSSGRDPIHEIVYHRVTGCQSEPHAQFARRMAADGTSWLNQNPMSETGSRTCQRYR